MQRVVHTPIGSEHAPFVRVAPLRRLPMKTYCLRSKARVCSLVCLEHCEAQLNRVHLCVYPQAKFSKELGITKPAPAPAPVAAPVPAPAVEITEEVVVTETLVE